MQFDENQLDPAFALLARGMPERPRRFWEAGLRRIIDAGHNRALGVGLGHYLLDRGRPVGVMLTIASPAVATPASAVADAGVTPWRGVINLSSWYIEPEYRWRAPLMLRRMTADPAFTYTSLTPIASVARLLEATGFKPLNRGLSVLPTLHPSLARPGEHRVVDLAALPPEASDGLGPQRLARMREHAGLGCVVSAFRDRGRWQALILKPCRIRGLAALRLIHCDSLSALDRQLGAVLRHLLARGRLLLVMDRMPGGADRGLPRPGGIGYRKGPVPADAVDHTGSELVYLDL